METRGGHESSGEIRQIRRFARGIGSGTTRSDKEATTDASPYTSTQFLREVGATVHTIGGPGNVTSLNSELVEAASRENHGGDPVPSNVVFMSEWKRAGDKRPKSKPGIVEKLIHKIIHRNS